VADAVRYFFDEHVSHSVTNGMRRHGADVLTVQEAGRRRLPDEEQIRFATSGGRVVVTIDIDYVTWAADFLARGEEFAGIVYCAPRRYLYHPSRLLQDLLILHGVYTADDMLNRVEYL
jgi:hypothetical protein